MSTFLVPVDHFEFIAAQRSEQERIEREQAEFAEIARCEPPLPLELPRHLPPAGWCNRTPGFAINPAALFAALQVVRLGQPASREEETSSLDPPPLNRPLVQIFARGNEIVLFRESGEIRASWALALPASSCLPMDEFLGFEIDAYKFERLARLLRDDCRKAGDRRSTDPGQQVWAWFNATEKVLHITVSGSLQITLTAHPVAREDKHEIGFELGGGKQFNPAPLLDALLQAARILPGWRTDEKQEPVFHIWDGKCCIRRNAAVGQITCPKLDAPKFALHARYSSKFRGALRALDAKPQMSVGKFITIGDERFRCRFPAAPLDEFGFDSLIAAADTAEAWSVNRGQIIDSLIPLAIAPQKDPVIECSIERTDHSKVALRVKWEAGRNSITSHVEISHVRASSDGEAFPQVFKLPFKALANAVFATSWNDRIEFASNGRGLFVIDPEHSAFFAVAFASLEATPRLRGSQS